MEAALPSECWKITRHLSPEGRSFGSSTRSTRNEYSILIGISGRKKPVGSGDVHGRLILKRILRRYFVSKRICKGHGRVVDVCVLPFPVVHKLYRRMGGKLFKINGEVCRRKRWCLVLIYLSPTDWWKRQKYQRMRIEFGAFQLRSNVNRSTFHIRLRASVTTRWNMG